MSNPVVQHSILSFSGRERWRNCPASVELSKGMKDRSGPAAAEGTCAHTVGEFYVRQAFDLPGAQPGDAPAQAPVMELDRFAKLVDQPAAIAIEATMWNEEMRQHGKAYVAFIRSLIPAGEQFFVSIEMRVAAKTVSDKLFGTLDCCVWLPRLRKLIIIDYKYGFVEVEIGDRQNPNAQLAAYAVAALDQCTLQADGGVTLAVFQPRRTFGAPQAPLELPPEWVAEERAKLAREVAATETPSAPVPGDHCRYCKAKSKCPTTVNALETAIQVHSGARDMLSIPTDALIDLWAARAAFKAFWEDVEERISQEVKNGNPRLQMTERQGRQMWADERDAALTLLAIGKTELLRPCTITDALPHLPEAWQKQLIRRSQPSRSIKLVSEVSPSQVAQTFAKYAKGVDNGQN